MAGFDQAGVLDRVRQIPGRFQALSTGKKVAMGAGVLAGGYGLYRLYQYIQQERNPTPKISLAPSTKKATGSMLTFASSPRMSEEIAARVNAVAKTVVYRKAGVLVDKVIKTIPGDASVTLRDREKKRDYSVVFTAVKRPDTFKVIAAGGPETTDYGKATIGQPDFFLFTDGSNRRRYPGKLFPKDWRHRPWALQIRNEPGYDYQAVATIRKPFNAIIGMMRDISPGYFQYVQSSTGTIGGGIAGVNRAMQRHETWWTNWGKALFKGMGKGLAMVVGAITGGPAGIAAFVIAGGTMVYKQIKMTVKANRTGDWSEFAREAEAARRGPILDDYAAVARTFAGYMSQTQAGQYVQGVIDDMSDLGGEFMDLTRALQDETAKYPYFGTIMVKPISLEANLRVLKQNEEDGKGKKPPFEIKEIAFYY